MRTTLLALLLTGSGSVLAQGGLAGKWYTTRDTFQLESDGAKVTGTFGRNGAGTLTGTVSNGKLSFTWREGRGRGSGTCTLAKSGHAFEGTWQPAGGRESTWSGWRKNPAATKGRPGKFAGPWRTSWGLMELTQRGKKVKGGLGAQGWTDVEGEVKGRVLELRYSAPYGKGTIWIEQRPGGKAAFGAAESGRGDWKFIARRLEGHSKKPKPRPGKIVAALGSNRLTYYLRVPKGWKRGKPAKAVVFLHGSNMSTRPYVGSLASTLGERFVIVGIDGEKWQDWSKEDDARHNYTYVNFMGESTYEGYPNTHRESPALVAELIQDLKKQLKLSKVFVGGHSQGGFLSYFFLMHYPDLVDGVFPMSCGLVMQCEPDVFDKPKLLAAQRRTPLAVVHGERDPTVSFSQGKGSFASFQEHGFPMIRLFTNQAGHMFMHLPFVAAIDWLDKMASDDPEELLAFARQRLDEEAYRDVSAAVTRLRAMKAGPKIQKRLNGLASRVDKAGQAAAKKLAAAIGQNADNGWVSDFLDFRDSFEFADCGKPVMAAYAKLRAEHEGPAKKLMGEARKLFRQGKRDAGWAKYGEIVDEYYASSLYVRVKGWIANRR